jgi:hypothetical protein
MMPTTINANPIIAEMARPTVLGSLNVMTELPT